MKNKFFYKKQFTNVYKKQSKLSETTSQVLYGEKFEILSKNINWLKLKPHLIIILDILKIKIIPKVI